MNAVRRSVLRGTVSSAVLTVALAAGLLRPGRVVAMPMPGRLTEILLALQSSNPENSSAIRVKAPDIAVDGASVFVDIACDLPEVDALIVFVDRNPQPLVAAFHLAPEVLPALQFRVKLSQTANIWAIAHSGGRFYRAAKRVTVTVGGCGAGFN